jgi:hypothetical protein
MNARFASSLLAASALALAAASFPALAQNDPPGSSSNVDPNLPPEVIMQTVPPDRGTNDDTSGGRVFRDQPFDVNGTEVVCTGIDSDSRHDPRWPAYSLKLEFAGEGGQYLGEERVSVTGEGVDVNVRCKGPWVLMKVPAGSYRVHATVANGGSKTVTVNVTGRGQTRAVLSFPAASGTTTPEGANTPGY